MGKLTVFVRRIAVGETVRHEMTLPSREGFPAVAAIGNDGRTVAIADPKPGGHTRNWSLLNRLNQKGVRPQDQPISIEQLSTAEREIIRQRYPELAPRR